MEWLEILLKIPVENLEEAANIANMAVPYGIYIEDYSDLEQGARDIAHIDLIDEELIKRDRETAIIHIYFGTEQSFEEAEIYLTERLKAAGIKFQLDSDSVLESSWKDNWKKYFKSTEIGDKLVIVPSWENYSEDNGRKVLTIDPGAAFGTGTHATTRLCLLLLQKYLNGGSMLDIGSGSGILAIGAALLGAESAVGVDIDATAVKVAKENAIINGVEGITEFTEGDLTEKISGKFDIVCANIVADVIMMLSDIVKSFMKPDGIFMCSGIIDIRAGEVEDCLISKNFEIIEHKSIDNWHAFVAKDKNCVC